MWHIADKFNLDLGYIIRLGILGFMPQQVRGSTVENELDRYLLTPPPDKKVKTLDYWRDHSGNFPHLNCYVNS